MGKGNTMRRLFYWESIKYIILGLVSVWMLSGCANAGKDQSVASEQSVTLDGSKSKADFHGQIRKYRWKQVRGTHVTLQSKKTAHPSFVAPSVSEESTFVFRLVTVERGGYISPWRTRDTVRITVKPSTNTNLPPVAIAEANISNVKEGDSIHFSAANSSDSDGQIVSYTWKDETGSLLSNAIAFDYTFATAGTHTLTLTVSDDAGLSSSTIVTVTVVELQVPIAQIQVSTISTTVGTTIHFDANASSDADGQIVSYQWIDESNTTLSNQMTLSHAFATSGEHTITLIIMDDDAQEGRASVNIVVEALLVSVDLSANALSLDVNETTSLLATANYNDNTSLDVTSSVVWTIANPDILSIDVNGTLRALQSGSTQITAQVGTLSSNTLNITVNTPITLQSLTVTPNPVELRVGESLQLSTEGTYSDGSIEIIDVADYIFTDTSVAIADPTGTLEALKVGSTSFRVKVGSRYSGLVFVSIGTELNTTNFNFTNFGNGYTDQIPVDATLTQYDEKRFCMIAGQIKAEDVSPLSGVKVSIFSHPEYGSVITDSNGSYTIPSEGGLSLTMRYAKQGYTTIDRKVYAPVQDWVRSPDVTMLALDSKVTTIDLNNNTPQIHISTKVTDNRGSRSTTLVFDGVSRATVIAPDGSARILHSIDVRATEFKTPDSMPSDLPKESAFTYCSDLSIDGTNDDDEILFDAPVVMYVNNFLGFEIGEIVPVGYYDRKDGAWKASDNGVVIKLLDTDNDGIVDALDSNGSDTPNDLDGDGSFVDEVAGLQNNPEYVAGKSYWRAEMMHLTPWDHNWAVSGPPEDAEKPKDIGTPPKPSCDNGQYVASYVTTQSRVFHEDIPIAGTDITLHYSSKRVDGYKHNIETSIDTTNAPSSVTGALVKMEVAGRSFQQNLTLNQLADITFPWNGKDVLGNLVVGTIKATITVEYTYGTVYYMSASTGLRAWARVGTSLGTRSAVFARDEVKLVTTKFITLHGENLKPQTIARGWGVSIHDKISNKTILLGDGGVEEDNKENISIITTIAGNGGNPGTLTSGIATQVALGYTGDVTSDNFGNLYIANSSNHTIQKIDKNGIISVVAGNGIEGLSGNGGGLL